MALIFHGVPKVNSSCLKAITYNQWLLVGRKTFESMGALPNRKYAVVTRSSFTSDNENVLIFPSIKDALTNLKENNGSCHCFRWWGDIQKPDRSSRYTTYIYNRHRAGR